MRTSDFDFHLPPELIAQEPAARREDARLLTLDRRTGATAHLRVPDLPRLLRAGDLLVVNDTKVLRARLFAQRGTGGRVEVFLLHPAPAEGDRAWEALVRAGGSILEGERLAVTPTAGGGDAGDTGGGGASRDLIRLVKRLGGGHWIVTPERVEESGADGGASARAPTFGDVMLRAGRMPLPPYIRRDRADARDALDAERYQTVFARHDGAVAAPTAGLHLSESILADLAARGVRRASVTLHVGLGTFKPVETELISDHPMHEEPWTIPLETAALIRETKAAGGRVVAVGTTSVRTLEAAAAESPDGLPMAGHGSTRLFILPGFRFRVVDALLTNFHLPRSTLLCLVSAFATRESVLAAYEEAVRERYRFFSYGDAMFLS